MSEPIHLLVALIVIGLFVFIILPDLSELFAYSVPSLHALWVLYGITTDRYESIAVFLMVATGALISFWLLGRLLHHMLSGIRTADQIYGYRLIGLLVSLVTLVGLFLAELTGTTTYLVLSAIFLLLTFTKPFKEEETYRGSVFSDS